MIRIRVSWLESFRRILNTDYGDEDALARAITGNPDPPNWMMEAGTAWHECLRLGTSRSGDYRFDTKAVMESHALVGPGVCEVPGSLLILPSVRVEGTADHIRGLVIQDHKTKFSSPDSRDYESSLQWRFYLLIHRASQFRYNLFDMANPTNRYCKLHGVLTFSFFPFADLREECEFWTLAFLDWARRRDLLACLEGDPYRKAA